MVQLTTNLEKELAHRVSNGIDVSLCWNELTNRVMLKVYDARFDEGFELEVDGRSALDAYRHPFAYATAEQTGNTSVVTDTLAACTRPRGDQLSPERADCT
jgi:hypothetical protein